MKLYHDFILFSYFTGKASEMFRPFFISAQSLADVRLAGELQKGKVCRRWQMALNHRWISQGYKIKGLKRKRSQLWDNKVLTWNRAMMAEQALLEDSMVVWGEEDMDGTKKQNFWKQSDLETTACSLSLFCPARVLIPFPQNFFSLMQNFLSLLLTTLQKWNG